MADQNTTNYSFVKPEIGASEDTWGEKLNANWDSADTEIKALQDSKVNNTGAETITGVKTFSDGIVSNVTGDVTGSTSWDGSGNASITATIADDSHNHTIANVDGLQTALNGKLSTSGKAADANLLDGLDSSQFLRSDTNTFF